MEQWDLTAVSVASTTPVVLATEDQARAILIKLDPGQEYGDHQVLEGAWFFGNGMVCFKTSYDFFMMALDGQKDVERMVREIKGMLPQAV